MTMIVTTPALDLTAVNAMDRDAFVAALGGAFEHSPWVADSAWGARPFRSVDELHASMVDVVRGLPREARVAFLCAHPELAGKEAEAGTMTTDSEAEQASAGLDALGPGELAELHRLNVRYRERHGFPFVIAVRQHDKAEIFEQLRRRTERDSDVELDEAMSQIAAITRLRVGHLVRAS